MKVAAGGASPKQARMKVATGGASPKQARVKVAPSGASPKQARVKVAPSGASPKQARVKVAPSGASPKQARVKVVLKKNFYFRSSVSSITAFLTHRLIFYSKSVIRISQCCMAMRSPLISPRWTGKTALFLKTLPDRGYAYPLFCPNKPVLRLTRIG